MQKNGVLMAAAMVLVLLSGCGGAPPPKENIDYGVNWALSYRIQWSDKSRNLFDSYKITNQYVEKKDSEKHYVYDFEAQVPIEDMSPPGQSFPNRWFQINTLDNPTPDDRKKIVTLSGSFTLSKKGNDWYCSETVR